MRGISWLAADQLASQKGLYTMEEVCLKYYVCSPHYCCSHVFAGLQVGFSGIFSCSSQFCKWLKSLPGWMLTHVWTLYAGVLRMWCCESFFSDPVVIRFRIFCFPLLSVRRLFGSDDNGKQNIRNRITTRPLKKDSQHHIRRTPVYRVQSCVSIHPGKESNTTKGTGSGPDATPARRTPINLEKLWALFKDQ